MVGVEKDTRQLMEERMGQKGRRVGQKQNQKCRSRQREEDMGGKGKEGKHKGKGR